MVTSVVLRETKDGPDQVMSYWCHMIRLGKKPANSYTMFGKYFRRFLPPDRKADILDLGCGPGDFLEYLQWEGYANCYGVDISQSEVTRAQKRGIENVMVADATEFVTAQAQNEYDMITAHDLLEHLRKEEILRLLPLCYAALGSGGTLIISVPNAEGPFPGRVLFGDFTRETAFTRNSLTQVLRTVGFGNIRIYPKGAYVHGLKSGLRWMLWKLIEAGIRCYLLVETGHAGSGIYTQTMFAAAGRRICCRSSKESGDVGAKIAPN